MRCTKVRRLLVDYMDESLPISLEEEVRLHLARCQQCEALCKDLGSTAALVRALPRLETSSDFARQLRRHLPVAVALSRRQPARSGFLAWLSQGALWGRRMRVVAVPVALALAASLYLWGQSLGVFGKTTVVKEPVISEGAYLAAVAREHAGYASEHPLIDSSAVNLKAVATATAP